MEVFSGEVRMRASDHFPDQISPFPSSFDSFFASCEVTVPSPDITTFPPQKLRPIRCNGKSVADCATDPEASAYDEFPVASGQGSLGVGFGELGFVMNPGNERVEGVGSVEAGYVGGGEMRTLAAAEVEVEARIGNDEIERQNLPSDSSSESEVSGDLLEHHEGSNNRKSRTRKGKRFEGLMQKLIYKVLVKQEAMHKQIMETIERNERERLMREEAWKQQQMEWMRRDEQMRAEETARNVALISFIQTVMGQDFQLPEPLQMYNLAKDEGELDHQRDIICDGTDDRFHTWEKDDSPDMKYPPPQEISLSADNRKWLKDEVQALIQLRGSLDTNFSSVGSKCSIWDEVSARLLGMGYHRTAKKCKEKWENMNKYFRRMKNNGITKRNNSKTCPYFQELDILCRQGIISPPCNPNPNNTHCEEWS